MSNFQPLKGITDIQDYTLSNDIQDGLIEYFDWGLLTIGNYFNVTLGELSPNGQDYSRLRYVEDNNYNNGQVWEAFRSNWVWQSGITSSPQPLVSSDDTLPGVSGVYVNDDYYPTSTTGTYSHYIDHFNGRVIFDSAIPTGSKVQVEYSYKWINIVYGSNVPWIRELKKQEEPDSYFLSSDKGRWSVPAESKLQLPAIAIEMVPRRRFSGYQLGGGQYVYTDMLFHCVADNEIDRNKLLDIVSLQNDKTIYLINSNSVNSNDDYPIDYRGVPVSGALRYPDLVDNYSGGKIRLTNSTIQDVVTIGSDLFAGVVRFTTEGIKTNI